MSRSKWKGPFLKFSNLRSTPTRAVSVVPSLIGKIFKIHNGCRYISIKIFSSMIGYKFGEFVFTKTSTKLKK